MNQKKLFSVQVLFSKSQLELLNAEAKKRGLTKCALVRFAISQLGSGYND